MTLDLTRNLSFHRLPVEFFEKLAAGGGSAAITQFLWETERSRRLLLIVTLFDHCEKPGSLGPLPSADDSWLVLEQARNKDPKAVDDLLLHPQVGSASAYALRRQRGGASSQPPTWIELGFVHTLALVAASRARLTWATRLAARNGDVMLPTLGMARFPGMGPASSVQARTEGGLIYLTDGEHEVVVGPDAVADGDLWWSLRHINVRCTNVSLTVWLDDLDPFRDLADPEPPARLDDNAFARWQQLLEEAWTLLCRHHPESAAAIAEGVVSVVPLRAAPGWDTRSASSGEAFGSVMVSEPPDAVTLAVSLVHEFQHIKLGALMHLLTLTREDDGSLYYAPWRDDPRPLGGFLQGVYAFFGIAQFWRQHRATVTGREADLANLEYLYARNQTVEAIGSIQNAPALTTTGHHIVGALGSAIATWAADSVEPRIGRLARLTADSHRTAWRLRHLRPTDSDFSALVKAWWAGEPPVVPGPPAFRPTPGLRWPQRIPKLVRQCVLRTAFSVDEHDCLALADRELVAGDVVVATGRYRHALIQGVNNVDDETVAWVGLTLALGDREADAAAAALLARPDLVRAVHREARAAGETTVDPIAVAAWLAPVVAAPA